MNDVTRSKSGAWFWTTLREAGVFLKTSFGSLASIEFATVLLPLLALWELAPRLGWVPRTLVPPASQVAATLWDLFARHGLSRHVGLSLGRFLLGLGAAVAFALPIGVLMGWNLFFRKHALPLFQLLAPVPPPAWVPITIVVLGVGLPMQIYLIFLGAFYPILFNTYQGVKDVDPRYVASARVFGASEWTLIRMIACMVVLGAIGWFLIEIMKYVEAKLALWRVGRQP